jgi:RNA polymerase sigma-70 factor (ECF subfamily)
LRDPLRQKADEAQVVEWLKSYLSSGNTQYWGRIFEKYKKPIFVQCHRMLKNEEDARDLTSDIFIKAFESIHRYDLNRPFFPWLYRIATNLCIDFIRRNYRVRSMQDKELENLRGEDDDNSGEENDTPRQKVKTAIDKMKRPQKLCFCLFYLHQKSYEDIVKLTGYSYDEVRSHIQNGRRKFKLVIER